MLTEKQLLVSDRPQEVAGQHRVEPAPLIQTSGLTKRYGQRAAVEDLHMTVRRGEVYGFLGPNGAGKTTTLKMLLGLIRPTSGSASVLGANPGDPAGLSRVGALVESPTFYPYLSGRDNLRVIARYAGISSIRVENVLEQVGLAERSSDKFKAYSLGMKQRLGIASALLKDPELLILDEPTNGLDPKGMAEMRELIRELGREGRTVLVSSHLLGEVEQICDRVGVILRGRFVAEGSVSELRGSAGLAVGAAPLDRAQEIAAQIEGVEAVQVRDGMLKLSVDPGRAGYINYRLVAAGVEVFELRPLQQSLEEVFLQLTEIREAI